MGWRHVVAIALAAAQLAGCRTGEAEYKPPPDARRPILKSDIELAAERDERIRAGEVVPSETPVVEPERRKFERPEPPPPGSIQSEMLVVNQSTLTVAEVLYPLRERILEARQSRAKEGLERQIDRWVRAGIQQEVGALLVYEKAVRALEEPRLRQLDQLVAEDERQRITREFGGSSARLAAHLARFGLSPAQYRERLKRQMVVQGYTRDILMPQVVVRREELIEYYRSNQDQFHTAGSRELLLIEAPFESFLPEDLSWRTALAEDRTRARLAARRHIRAAETALKDGRDFGDVAAEFSRGPNRESGGSWGPIGKPLAPPWDGLTAQIFEFTEGQFSEPIELESGWYIVGCGRVHPAQNLTFAEAQEKIRDELSEQRFNRLASDYVMKLAEKSTISSLDAFVKAAVKKALSTDWPRGEG